VPVHGWIFIYSHARKLLPALFATGLVVALLAAAHQLLWPNFFHYSGLRSCLASHRAFTAACN